MSKEEKKEMLANINQKIKEIKEEMACSMKLDERQSFSAEIAALREKKYRLEYEE